MFKLWVPILLHKADPNLDLLKKYRPGTGGKPIL